MARILGGLASSHTPTIGFAVDTDRRDDPAWAPMFADYEPVRQWLADKQPDVLFFIYNDHVTSFFSITTRSLRSELARNSPLPTKAEVRGGSRPSKAIRSLRNTSQIHW